VRRSTKRILWLLGTAVAIAVAVLLYFLMQDNTAYEDKRDLTKKSQVKETPNVVIAKVWMSWPEFAGKVALTQDAGMCETGQEKLVDWNEKYRVRCMAIATRDPRYCSYFDAQPNAEKNTPMFQQICITEVLKLSPRDMTFSPQVCAGLAQYPAFRFMYNECVAMVTRNGNYCVANQDVPTPGSMPNGAEQSLQCLANLASYTQNSDLCKLAHQYEQIFLSDGRLDMPAGDILFGCPLPF
jgi:hypothetical protein